MIVLLLHGLHCSKSEWGSGVPHAEHICDEIERNEAYGAAFLL